MNALRVDQWQHSLRRGFMETYSIDEASEQMLRELFAITDELKSVMDDDDVKVFWIWAKRPTFKQYKAYYYDDACCNKDSRDRMNGLQSAPAIHVRIFLSTTSFG